jgi:DNA-binding NarL/FixJ family response regulator
VRVILADDAVVIRHGLARLLAEAGVEVCAEVGDADALLWAVSRTRPDVAVVDIRMPPSFTDEGLRAAQRIRALYPRVGVVVLSQYVDAAYATKLTSENARSMGYLLKDRILDVGAFVEALGRVAGGGCVVEPALVEELVDGAGPLGALTAREREVLALIAEGHTDRGIGEALFLSQKTVESHVRSIFRKLDLPATPSANRRVHAVLAFLQRR